MDDDSSTDNEEVQNELNKRQNTEEIKISLQHSIMKITEAADSENCTRMSAQALRALAELTFQYATTSLASDLNAFSSHANRRTINLDDVQLMARKHPETRRRLNEFCERLTKATEVAQKPKQPRTDAIEVDSMSSSDEEQLGMEGGSANDSKDSPQIASTAQRSRRTKARKPDSAPLKRGENKEDSSSDNDSFLEKVYRRPNATAIPKQIATSRKEGSRDGSSESDPGISKPRNCPLRNQTRGMAGQKRSASDKVTTLLEDSSLSSVSVPAQRSKSKRSKQVDNALEDTSDDDTF